MVKTRPLYVMISQTDTAIARLIRAFCQYPYNHVSLTLDPEFKSWYSYARYVHDAPFYGGFVKEPAERFLAASGETNVRIFRVELPAKQAETLEKLFREAGKPGSDKLYNYYDAIASGFGMHMDVPGAHTCLSFACSVLGLNLRSIEELNDHLLPSLIYEGSLSGLVSDSGCRDDLYFTELGLLRGTAASTMQLCALSTRLIVHGISGYLHGRLHRTAP